MRIDDNLKWGKMPVPWVARWSAEVTNTPYGLGSDARGKFVGYRDGELITDRGRHGELWIREDNTKRGQGTPDFGALSSLRQRKCFYQEKCQVCGGKVEPPYYWLLSQLQVYELTVDVGYGPDTTTNPMVCEECVEVAPMWCPTLKKKFQLLRVNAFEPLAVFGEVITPQRSGYTRELGNVLLTEKEKLRLVVAKQLVVRLKDYKVVDLVHS